MMSTEARAVGPLAGLEVAASGEDLVSRYGRDLLTWLGAHRGGGKRAASILPMAVPEGLVWADSGGMWLTGRPHGPPLPAQGAPASVVVGAVRAFESLVRWSGRTLSEPLPGSEILGERAASFGLRRQGPSSPGGTLRMIEAADGWVGINLPRVADCDLLPALTHGAVAGSRDALADMEVWTRRQSRSNLAERARLLQLPFAVVPDAGGIDEQQAARWACRSPRPFLLTGFDAEGHSSRRRTFTVVDCSTLWAGPLAGHILGLAGCRVIKVEDPRRPDGGRSGASHFYNLLHAGHESVAIDFRSTEGRRILESLFRTADLVITSSRPRAMDQLGIEVDEIVASGTSWLSITGYGCTGPWQNQPAFGDDAAIAGGLVAFDDEGPLPAADAIADPLTGVHAALAGFAALIGSGSWLIDVSMRDVALVAAQLSCEQTSLLAPRANRPRCRRAVGTAAALGADTRRVLTEFRIR